MTARAAMLAALLLVPCATTPRMAWARRCPNIMFVVDTSADMRGDAMGGGQRPSRWDLVSVALAQLPRAYGGRVRFGLVTFGSTGGSDLQCYTDAVLRARCAPGLQALQALSGITPGGINNAGDAIRRAITDGRLDDPERENYLVLVTGGDPGCNGSEPQYVLDQITRAAALTPSVRTYVVGFDGPGGASPKLLDQMALAGRTAVVNCVANKVPCYLDAGSLKKLQDAIDNLLTGIGGNGGLVACDDSCFGVGCADGQVCDVASSCAMPACRPDPCRGVPCDGGRYCKEGRCLLPCPPCGAGARCAEETCRPDPCALVKCDAGRACDGAGRCVPDRCFAAPPRACALPTTCDPLTGCCAGDPCALVNCPPGSTCRGGYCETDPAPPQSRDMTSTAADLSVAPARPGLELPPLVPESGCACAVTARPGSPPSPLLLLLPIIVAASRLTSRRRRRSR